MRKNDKICNEENMEYKPLHRTFNNLIQDFCAKDINSKINSIDKSSIKMFTPKTTNQQLCMFHASCFKVTTLFVFCKWLLHIPVIIALYSSNHVA